MNNTLSIKASNWANDAHNFDLKKYIDLKNINFSLINKDNLDTNKISYQKLYTPIGVLIACFRDNKLQLLDFIDSKYLKENLLALDRENKFKFQYKASKLSKELCSQLNEYFNGTRLTFNVPIENTVSRTEFHKLATSVLSSIPYGNVISYKEQATILGNINAVRAVAKANSKNNIAILIPCHRVIGSNGKLVGYAGGLERKKYLLNLEKNSLINTTKQANTLVFCM